MKLTTIACTVFLLVGAGLAAAWPPPPEPPGAAHGPAQVPGGALEAFGALAVGEWTAEDARNTLTWGVGRKIIHSKSYFLLQGEWTLVSEGVWYADPSGAGVRGVVVAIEMPVELFEYRSEVRGESIVHQLVGHGEMGGEYRETWSFDDEGYEWTLETEAEGAMQRVMGGAYQRAR